MNLTGGLPPGTTLQNQKYVIQKQLHQSEVGITYQAHHAYLDQPVLLQSLSEALRQRSNFAQIRQQFLHRVRTIAQQPQSRLRVLDCFEEGEMPFVVFELGAGQTDPTEFPDWLPALEPEVVVASGGLEVSPDRDLPDRDLPDRDLSDRDLTAHGARPSPLETNGQSPERLAEAPTAAEAESEADRANSPNSLATAQAFAQPDGLLAAVPADSGPADSGPADSRPADSEPRLTQPDSFPAALNGSQPQPSRLPSPELGQPRFAESSVPTAALASENSQATLPVAPLASVVPKSARRLGLMPLALVFTSLLAGLLGAGLGYLLRFSSTAETGTPRLAPRLFSREQSFPSEADWPISETPQTFSDPTPVEAPIYRSTGPALPDYQPLPSTNFVPAPAPLPVEPPATQIIPPSPAPVAPVPPVPVEPAPPQVSDVPAPAAEPAPPAPEPPINNPPPPPIALPQPAAPELPREPQVLKN